MKRQILTGLLVLLSLQGLATARVLRVPSQYSTIQSAINNASNGDIILVAAGTYRGSNNTNIDFKGKAITLQSEINIGDPQNIDWDKIASTIIDCQGSRYISSNAQRAFWFHTKEGPNSKVIGFTIKNGYARGGKTANGTFGVSTPDPYERLDPGDPESPPRAERGKSCGPSHQWGGAILCESSGSPAVGSSPTIQYCIISDSIVTGCQGGNGAIGQDGRWTYTLPPVNPDDPNEEPENRTTPNGQWGGHGGDGYGDGHGGAIACRGGSNPRIESCIIRDNMAQGGVGGNGGNGGNAAGTPPSGPWSGSESGSGSGGNGYGDGKGGAIYCDNHSNAKITNCTFSNNVATYGSGGAPGIRGSGNTYSDPPQPLDGTYGAGYPFTGDIFGGAACYLSSNPDFTNCTFTTNEAWWGGALYSYSNNTVILNDCEFSGHLGGAVYCESGNNLTVDNCSFLNNTEAWNGGAIFTGTGGSTDIRNSTFGGNSAYGGGGALYSQNNTLVMKNCSFGGNRADDNGGAIYAYRSTSIAIDVNSCTFSGNQSGWGGGVYLREFAGPFTNCYFNNNTAESGGAITFVDGTVSIANSSISENSATAYYGYGGGIDCINTNLTITDSAITNNSADGGQGTGGGINFDCGYAAQVAKNCLVTGNTADIGGGIAAQWWVDPNIINCTFNNNSAAQQGGAVFCDWTSQTTIVNSIFQSCNGHAIHEENGGGNVILKYSLFFENPYGDFYDSGTRRVYKGSGDIGSIPGGINNLYGNPKFVDGPLGGFYLSQIAAGQGSNSPAVDSGSDSAVNLGLDTYTTRTDELGDTGWVDRGYHYHRRVSLQRFGLTTSVIGGHGNIIIVEPEPLDPDDPNNHIPPGDTRAFFYAGTTVTLKARPDPGWKIKTWDGTDDDTLNTITNTVTMISDRTVTVEFRQSQTYTAGADGDYTTIEAAIVAADDGDIIVVAPGVWHGITIYVFKAVIIRSVDPNHPEDTIIDRRGTPESGFWIYADATLDGFTIQNSRTGMLDADDGPDPGDNGADGGWNYAGGIGVFWGSSPVIKNCTIKNNLVVGGRAGDGANADDTYNAGRGGWGGRALGSGVYCEQYTSPTLINCRIIDNNSIGGSGGDGGDGVEGGGGCNCGGNWSDGYLWTLWWMISEYDADDNPVYWGPYIGDYRWYSAYGGGVYCGEGSNVTFTDCTISGNRTSGGMSGIGGAGEEEGTRCPPLYSYQLPSFGGGVYCAADSVITFTDCEITNNTAAEPNETYHLDPYLGHGGGVAAERTATLIFKNCTISENTAPVGGGVYLADANPRVIDSRLTSNKAYNGGGLYGVDGTGTIIGCNIAGNQAFGYVTDPNAGDDPEDYDPNNDYYLPGNGAGIHCDSTTMNIIDCTISDNTAGASGGGVYFIGPNSPSLTNCLITNNNAGKSGAGVAATILNQPLISNCTIALNTVSGTYYLNKYGGGLDCSYEANTNIVDSILWGNSADNGPQIAIHNSPAAVTVGYSDVQGGAIGIFIDAGCILNWDDASNLTGTVGDPGSEPQFVEGYFLSQPPNQTALSPCVNSGSADAEDLNMYKHTTRTDGVIDGTDPFAGPDDHIVDIGYHYVLTTTLVGDFNFDGIVDFSDYAIFLDHWLEEGCQFPYWCQGTDLNEDGMVNYRDYNIFAGSYLETETTAPTPNPMTWAVPPTSTGSGAGSITMTATTATDNSGSGVQYIFDCVYHGGSGGDDSPWQSSPTYTDTGLEVGKKYGYKVKARDLSANRNETEWSLTGYAIAGSGAAGGVPAAPSNLVATAVSSSQIDLSWMDNSDNETGFKIERKIVGGTFTNIATVGANVRSYSDTGLTPQTTYTYRVYAYNAHGDSTYSNEAFAITPEEGGVQDILPPLPNPSQWAVYPTRSPITGIIYMAAVVADDATTGGNNPVWYYFDCVNGTGLDSGWQQSPIYTYMHSSHCTYVVRTKDNVGNVGIDSIPGYTGR